MGEQLVYQGTLIRERDEMLSLTDMWRAGGSVDAKRPAEWLRQEATVQFIECIEASLNVGQAHIIAGQRGRGGSTFAHWQVALAYAKYLSPEFHMWCNSVVRAHMEAMARPKVEPWPQDRIPFEAPETDLGADANRATLS